MTASRTFRTHASGFTLLELLLAVAAFALVLAAINGVFYGALKLRNKAVAGFDESLPLQQTLSILKRDIANIVVPGGKLSGTLQTSANTGINSTDTSSSSSSTSSSSSGVSASTSVNDGMLLGQSSPTFYTATGSLDETSPFAEVQKVSYQLVSSTNLSSTGRDLVRSVTRNLLPSLQAQAVKQSLLTGVQSITFQFHDGSQWRETWDSTTEDSPRLPRAIKVQLQMAAEQDAPTLPTPVQLVVPLLVDGGSNTTAQSSSQ
jgi:prepilin-type N-terminal cleavage/methylation domain-containing protein